MLELIIIVILALLGGDTGDYPSSGSRSKPKQRTSYSSHDIGCDDYCYDCDDYHDDY